MRRARLRADGRLGVVVVGQVPPPVHGQALVHVALAAGRYERLDLELAPMRFSRDVADVGRVRPGKALELPRVLARALRARGRGSDRRDVLVYGVGLRGRGAALRDAVLLAALRPWFSATVLQVHTGDTRAVLRMLPPPLRWLAERAYRGADLVLYPDPLLDADDGGLPGPRRVEYLVYGIDDPLAGAAGGIGGLAAGPDRVEVGDGGAEAAGPEPGPEVPEGPGAEGAGAEGGGPDAGPLVLFMANLYPSKGTEVLIDAFASVVAERPASGAPLPRLVLVGAPAGPDTFAELRARAARAGVDDRVGLPGPAFGEDKAALFRAASVFCFPTSYEAEAMPLVLFEAMAHGLPVLTTAWRAIPRVVTDGVDGVLVPPGDVDRLAAELGRLIADPALRQRLGAAARTTFERRFTVDAFRAQFEELLWGAFGAPRLALVAPARRAPAVQAGTPNGELRPTAPPRG